MNMSKKLHLNLPRDYFHSNLEIIHVREDLMYKNCNSVTTNGSKKTFSKTESMTVLAITLDSLLNHNIFLTQYSLQFIWVAQN